MSENSDVKMKYRLLGNTGLCLSVFGYGMFGYGTKPDQQGDKGIELAKENLKIAREAGINYFDVAEVYGYPDGSAEKILGEALKQLQLEDEVAWRRSALVISTKIFWCEHPSKDMSMNETGLSRRRIIRGLDESLKRLQLDYVDLLFCHRPDPYTSTETVVQAMSDAVRSGKASAWGTSAWSAQQITEAYYIAQRGGHIPPAFEQPQYNMVYREAFEKEYFPLYRQPYKMGTTIWSPLNSGLLTGKYKDGIPQGSRLDEMAYKHAWMKPFFEAWTKSGNETKVTALNELAEKELNCSMAQLALAWCIKNKNVTTALLGASKPEQLRENLGSLKVLPKLTDEVMDKIEKILQNKPEPWECQMRPLPLMD